MGIDKTRDVEDKFTIEWNPKYEIGIAEIDEQHKKLVALVAQFYKALMRPGKSDTWKGELTKTLHECCAYVQTHFKFEEELLQKAGYPDFANHKAQHDEFTRKVLETAKNFNASTPLTAVKFARFLYDWILAHISHTDRLYVPYIKQ